MFPLLIWFKHNRSCVTLCSLNAVNFSYFDVKSAIWQALFSWLLTWCYLVQGGWTALMWASYKGHTTMVSLLLSHSADINTQGPHHTTSLLWAAGRGHTAIAKQLLARGAKVNIGDKFGTTPLIWACRKGYFEICRSLLEHGANTDATGMVRIEY